MITLTSITKRYGNTVALSDVSFTARQGEVLGLLGQNGAGKTTALNIITGCLAPSAGSVTIGGHDLIQEPRQARRLVGYLPEVPPLYDEMTVRAYLRFACELKLVLPADIPAHVEEIATRTGLKQMLGRRIGNLSKGYRQRVGLAQALCGDPEVLILDEPTSGLDPRQTAEFRETLREQANGRTVLFSSHILSEVQALCDRVIILHHGQIVLDSNLKQLQSGSALRLRADIQGDAKVLLPALRSLAGVRRVTRLPLICTSGMYARRMSPAYPVYPSERVEYAFAAAAASRKLAGRGLSQNHFGGLTVMRAVYKRELQSFFCTPHAYVFTGVFLLLGSVFFAVGNLAAHSSDLNGFLWNAGYLWMLLTPVLTMHVYAGERRAHTDQLLFSSPVSLWGVALGKYLATITVLGLTVFLSLIYAGLIAIYGRLYPSEALCGYLGFSLQGSAFVAIDLYVSARSRTPVTAAVWAVCTVPIRSAECCKCSIFHWCFRIDAVSDCTHA